MLRAIKSNLYVPIQTIFDLKILRLKIRCLQSTERLLLYWKLKRVKVKVIVVLNVVADSIEHLVSRFNHQVSQIDI